MYESHSQPCGTVRLGHGASVSASAMAAGRGGKPTIFRTKPPKKSFKEARHGAGVRGGGSLPCRTGVTGFRGNCSWAAPDRGRAPPLAYGGLAGWRVGQPKQLQLSAISVRVQGGWTQPICVPVNPDRREHLGAPRSSSVADMICAISQSCLLTLYAS